MELLLGARSARLVVEWFEKAGLAKLEFNIPFPGEGRLGGTRASFSLEKVMVLGLEKSFILELFDLASFSEMGSGE